VKNKICVLRKTKSFLLHLLIRDSTLLHLSPAMKEKPITSSVRLGENKGFMPHTPARKTKASSHKVGMKS